MRALIFAAGRGERMRPLTDTTPKPLLPAAGKPLIVHHLEHLAAAGIREVVINTSHLAEQFPATLGDGDRWGICIRYAREGRIPLETGGGMLHALPLLGNEPFVAVNGDIHTDFDYARLPRSPAAMAHLVLIDNPPHHPDGDFHLSPDGSVHMQGLPRLTFAGIGVYRPQLLEHWRAVASGSADEQGRPRFPLAPLLTQAMQQGSVSGEHHHGYWTDVGTPQRLAQLAT